MSIFRDHAFGYNTTDKQEQERELRRRINENLKNIYSGKYRREADAKRKEKLTELEKASADEIERGAMVIEFRELRKLENRYARKKNLTDDDRGHWEEIDARLDTLRDELDGYTRDELSRFVRLWNKSRKVRYKL
jgi:lipopolysaccharide export LptBFGC system permease protein LptF